MVLFHADADIIFNYDVRNIKQDKEYCLLSNNRDEIKAKNIILTNGMGAPKKNSFKKDKKSKQIITGDEFISKSFISSTFFKSIKNKKIAVIGKGDTANCVMEYLLPLVYPNYYYGFYRKDLFFPKLIYWIGQDAKNIQDYFFANKSRYCHSGGIIEFFWDQETPFELSTEVWKKTKNLIKCVPSKVEFLEHKEQKVNLKTKTDDLTVDLLIDCTGRLNNLSRKLLKGEYEFVQGDITLFGGMWNDELSRFTVSPRELKAKNLTQRFLRRNKP